MILGEGLPFIRDYVDSVNAAIKKQAPEKKLSRLQCYWLSFVILGVLVTNTLCWNRFERFSMGKYKSPAMCWVFRKSKLAWDLLLYGTTLKLLEFYGIRQGILAIDDTDSERSKNTTEIAKVHKIRDKKRSGFFHGQNIVFLLLVTEKITIPVGFEFHEPDPALTIWRREDKRLRKSGVSNQFRPKRPNQNADYPSKKELALKLLKRFVSDFPTIKIKAVVADLFYDTQEFMTQAHEITGQSQVISQIKRTQMINVNGIYVQVEKFFENYQGKTEIVQLRHHEKKVTYRVSKFKVKSHQKKCYVIALKYEDESEYRYLIAYDMSWNGIDVIKAYALRWLVEVFIQDWKSYEGWSQLAMQRGIEGSERGLTISLLSDHVLHFHQEQIDLYEDNKPAATVGSLREKIMMESLSAFIEKIVKSDDPKALFDGYADKISELFALRSSLKHMRGTDIETLGTPMPC